ncbi:MAG: response regulator [Candidatus Omnitrophica bacterium]|nr:response regulator [Candidatus Omnitrophota bacterium]
MKKILIIEDDPSVARVLQERLTKSGFDIFIAVDAYQGLTTAKSELPDLIILDLMLPGGGGETTFQNLKRTPKTSRIPVLVLTASRDAEVKQKMLDAGVAGFMEKPYEASELIGMVSSILQERGKT